MNILLMEGK